MNESQARKLAWRIEKDAPACHVTGLRSVYPGPTYEVVVADTMTGYPFTVRSPESWEERKREAANGA